MKKNFKILCILCFILPNILFTFHPIKAYAAMEERISQAKSYALETLKSEVTSVIENNREQQIYTDQRPKINIFSYKSGVGKTSTESGHLWGKEAYVMSMNPIYTVSAVDRSLISVDVDNPTNGSQSPPPSSLTITAVTNKEIDTSFILEIKDVYTVYHTYWWETFSGYSEDVGTSVDSIFSPLTFIVHVTKQNEEGSVKVQYLDLNTQKEILPSETFIGKIGKSYTQTVQDACQAKTTEITKNHYQFVRSAGEYGTFNNDEQTVNYYFERSQGGDLIVQHQNTEENLNLLQKQEFEQTSNDIVQGKYGELVVAQAKKLPHYQTLDGVTSIYTPLGDTAKFITFKYKLISAQPVTIRYVDQDGNQIPGIEEKVINGRWGDDYSISPKTDIPFYTLTDKDEAITGNLSDEAQEIVFHYQVSNGADVIVHYYDEAGVKIKEDKVLTGLKYGRSFTEKPIAINHFHPKNDEVKGQVSDKVQEITFVYQRNNGAPVKVHFVDDHQHILSETIQRTGVYDAPFDVSQNDSEIQKVLQQLAKEHYEIEKVSGVVTGNFLDQKEHDSTSEITYSFKKKSVKPVQIICQDTYGNILKTETLSGVGKSWGEAFEVPTESFLGFDLQHISLDGVTLENACGVYDDEKEQTLTFTYQLKHAAPVSIQFLDLDTMEEIHPMQILALDNGYFGDIFEVSAANFEHYIFRFSTFDNKMNTDNLFSGTFTATPQSLIYYYTKDKTSLETKNLTLFLGENWKEEDNFISATNANGEKVSFNALKCESDVDTKKVGTYTVNFSYKNIQKSATVEIKERKDETPVPDKNTDTAKPDATKTEIKWLKQTKEITRAKFIFLTSKTSTNKEATLPLLSETQNTVLMFFGFFVLFVCFLLMIIFWKNRRR